MPEFKKGDIVQLKSGGPDMTVTSVQGEEIWCIWFAGKKLETESFYKGTIIQVAVLDSGPGDHAEGKRPGK